MGYKTVRDNFRVEVRPRAAGDFGLVRISGRERAEEDSRRICEDIAADIRRHVDNLPSYGDRGVSVECDEHKVCAHCGHRWTEDSSTYNGGCCDEDEKNNPHPAEHVDA